MLSRAFKEHQAKQAVHRENQGALHCMNATVCTVTVIIFSYSESAQ